VTLNSFKSWLNALGQAWITRDPKAAANICAENVLYFETPFDKPLTSKKEIEEIWLEVPNSQKDIEFNYEIVSVNQEIGVAKWRASFTRLPLGIRDTLDGIYIAKLDNDGLCKEFHQWWVVKPST
jgi:hypothetical protein